LHLLEFGQVPKDKAFLKNQSWNPYSTVMPNSHLGEISDIFHPEKPGPSPLT